MDRGEGSMAFTPFFRTVIRFSVRNNQNNPLWLGGKITLGLFWDMGQK
jgi:hypothetical protein